MDATMIECLAIHGDEFPAIRRSCDLVQPWIEHRLNLLGGPVLKEIGTFR